MNTQRLSGDLPAVDQSLSEQEYARLAAILDEFSYDEVMGLEEMDGFFAALVCSPDLVPPSVFLNEVWADDEAPFASPEDFAEFVNLALRHWNSVSHALEDSKEIFLPWLKTEDGEEESHGNQWAHGFLRGMALCRDSWDEFVRNKDNLDLLIPVMALAHEDNPDPELRPWKTPPDRQKRFALLAGLAAATQLLYNRLRPRRMRKARVQSAATRASRPKIGRNDPCYCGSGKKYKRCCGSVTVN